MFSRNVVLLQILICIIKSLNNHQVGHWSVLLLEAGPDENELSDVPSLAAYLQLSRLDWQYKTEPTGKSQQPIFIRVFQFNK